MLVRLSALVALLLPSFSEAVTSFMYNQDIQCGYPFEDFQITSLHCMDAGESYAYAEQDEDGDEQERNEACYLGQEMHIEGKVTLSEQVYRYMKVGVKLCLKQEEESTSVWWQRDRCVKYNTNIDMLTTTEVGYGYYGYGYDNPWTKNYNQDYDMNYDQQNQNAVNGQEYQSNYLYAGEHTFRARIEVPDDKFEIKTGYIMSAEVTFYPKKSYKGLDYDTRSQYEKPWYSKKKTYCLATFSPPYYEYYEYYAAAGAGVAVVGVLASLYARKRRTVATESKEVTAGQDVSTGFESMSNGVQT